MTISKCHNCILLVLVCHCWPTDNAPKLPAEQTSWPNWQTLVACTEADA